MIHDLRTRRRKMLDTLRDLRDLIDVFGIVILGIGLIAWAFAKL